VLLYARLPAGGEAVRVSRGYHRKVSPRYHARRVSHDPVIPEMPEVWGGPEAWEAWRGDGPSVSSGRPVKSEWMRAKERQMEEFLRRYGKR